MALTPLERAVISHDLPELISLSKVCSDCGIEKSVLAFALHKTSKGGLKRQCRKCLAARQREYVMANPQKVKESDERWRKNHPHKVKAYRKASKHLRRIKLETLDMTDEDKDITFEYRLAIANDPCFYCKQYGEMEDDHFFPIAKGGTDHWWNIVRSCAKCNHGTGGKHATCGTRFMLKRGI